jgi:hypothetical protein
VRQIDALKQRRSTPMNTIVKFPDIEVELTGTDGNAYAILGAVQKALRTGGASDADVKEFHAEATSGDYDHLLQTCMRWVEVS